jgi:hypothetical protein
MCLLQLTVVLVKYYLCAVELLVSCSVQHSFFKPVEYMILQVVFP